MNRRRALVAAGAALALAAWLLTGVAPSTAYQNVTAETCGSAGRCHGPVSGEVVVTIEGPDVVVTGTTVQYSITINGGPARRYGYFILFVDPDGRGRDLAGDPLFHVEPNSLTRLEDTNGFVVNFTAPRYAVSLKMRVAANSANGNSAPSGDAWGFSEKGVDVRHPVEAEAPYRSLPGGTLPVAAVAIVLAGSLIVVFYFLSRQRVHRGGA